MSRVRTVAGAVVWAATACGLPRLALGQISAAARPLQGDSVEASIRVVPDTVTIGAPFRVVLHVRTSREVTVQFPPGPDSGGSVEALDPRTVAAATGDSTVTDLTASYRLAAWDVGQQSIALGNLTIRGPRGVRAVPVGDLTVLVASTLPPPGPASSSSARRPKPARPIFPAIEPWWRRGAIAALALLAILALWLIVRGWRRRRRRPAPVVGPFAVAERGFLHLDRLGLVDAGECGRYVALLGEIVRTYLARRLGHAALSSTTSELVSELRADAHVPIERLRALLAETDLVKFANRPASPDRARALGSEARSIVTDIERSVATAAAATADAVSPTGRPSSRGRRVSGHAA